MAEPGRVRGRNGVTLSPFVSVEPTRAGAGETGSSQANSSAFSTSADPMFDLLHEVSLEGPRNMFR